MERMYDDPKQEAESIKSWLDRRLEWADTETLPLYVKSFKKMWLESFGTLDTIPQDYKDKVSAKYLELKENAESSDIVYHMSDAQESDGKKDQP